MTFALLIVASVRSVSRNTISLWPSRRAGAPIQMWSRSSRRPMRKTHARADLSAQQAGRSLQRAASFAVSAASTASTSAATSSSAASGPYGLNPGVRRGPVRLARRLGCHGARRRATSRIVRSCSDSCAQRANNHNLTRSGSTSSSCAIRCDRPAGSAASRSSQLSMCCTAS